MPKVDIKDYISDNRDKLTARLMPTTKIEEGRATSLFLATLSIVDEYAKILLKSVGQSLGARANVECFTEVIPPQDEDEKNRPDGLISLSVKKGVWKWAALIEAKIGNAELKPDQVKKYIEIARDNNLHAVITISNHFAALPTHYPAERPNTKISKVKLYHWSWTYLRTQAELILEVEQSLDPEQAYILEEFVRFLQDKNSGAKTFDLMNKEWPEVCKGFRQGDMLKANSEAAQNTVGDWFQEQRDLSLKLTRRLKVPVSIRMTNNHKNNPEKRLKDECVKFVKSGCLGTYYDIPNAASPLCVKADSRQRTICISMEVLANDDRVKTPARVNWLLSQMKAKGDKVIVKVDRFFVDAVWPGKANGKAVALSELIDDPTLIQCENKGLVPSKFIVSSQIDLGASFASRKKFLHALNEAVEHFYGEVGQHIKQWQKSAPSMPEEIEEDIPDAGID